MSIADKLKAYRARTKLRFHTPGHAGLLDRDDVTEIDGAFPLDTVQNAERAAAAAFGVEHLRFLVCGSSMGVKAAIMAAGQNLLAEDISHRAVEEGAKLARVGLVRLTRRREEGLAVPPSPEEIEDVLKANPSVGAVVLTSPDYYGRCVALETFEAVRRHNKTLIVDSAHGAHFAFSPLFPPSPCRVADYCNMSAHKTLYAYTQTAYLAVNVDPAPVDEALRLLGTTSPSYLFLSGLETAITKAQTADYARLKAEVDQLKSQFVFAENDDFSRLVLDAKPFGVDGHTMYRALYELGVAAETADERYVVLIATPHNADALAALAEILESIDGR